MGELHLASLTAWDWLGWVILAISVWHLWPMWYGLVWPRRIGDVPPLSDAPALPLVSIIVPARDEAAAVEACLRSLLALDYPHHEVIAIDDRSTDGTGVLMDRIAGSDPRLHVVHLTELPPGWLGKNHANMVGARQARGEYLLFTDGDVMFDPAILRHAIGAMQRGRLDHLALFPDAMMRTFGEIMLMNYFSFLFSLITQLWLVRFRWARNAFVGVGAFNLIRRDAYERIGTHERLRMEVADDMMLGKLVKNAGLRQDAMAGAPLVRVKWQTGLWGIICGLEKNAFAGARFSLPLVITAIVIHISLAIGPFVLLALGLGRLPLGIFVGMSLLTHAVLSVRFGHSPLYAFTYPAAAVIQAYILARSAWRTLRDGGITWRETFYPLADLRAGMIEWRPIRAALWPGDNR